MKAVGPRDPIPYPGKYDEEWIAYGSFDGMIDKTPASGTLYDTARAMKGGLVDGRIAFGDGVSGSLVVRGHFSDGYLTYTGRIR